MGEQEPSGHISCRPDLGRRSSHFRIDANSAALVQHHAGVLQSEPLSERPHAGGNEYRIFARKDGVEQLDHGHLGAWASEDPSELETNGTGTQDREPGRLLIQLEGRLVSQIPDLFEGRDRGGSPGGSPSR
jgi:hypothetical protein